MKTIPQKCKDISAVSSFCDCIADAESFDEATEAFCTLAKSGSVGGDDAVALKQALIELDR